MAFIPENTAVDTAFESAVNYVVSELKTRNTATLTRSDLNKEQAKKLADEFRAHGYHHEIRMHTNNYGNVFFYCVTISKTPIRTNDARFAWSEYVR